MASIHTDTSSSHYCKPRQAAHKPTNTSGSCYQQFLCAQNDSNTQMGCVVSHRYTSPVSTARPRDHNISASCCTTPAKQPPRGRDKQSKGILDDTQAITNSRISYDCKPVYFSGFSATGDRQFGKSSLICFAKPKGILGSTTCCLSSGYIYYELC